MLMSGLKSIKLMNYKSLLLKEWKGQNDPSHDLAHIERVLRSALLISEQEGGSLDVIIPSVWFHDLINLPKNHAERHKASEYSANRAIELLKEQGLEDDKILSEIHHAILAHSFSAGVESRTIEAKIVQDADRLDSLGCIGMMRTFAVSGILGRPLFDLDDPFARHRDLDDASYALDHFEVKLFKIAQTLNTKTAQDIAQERVSYMKAFLERLEDEIIEQPQALAAISASS